MDGLREVARGLCFPEGPIALPDGSVLVVEIARGTLTRVSPDGRLDVVAQTGGGPNGAALGPDGACYICNNGGFTFEQVDGQWHVVATRPPIDQGGGRIERVDLASGKVEILYDSCDGHRLSGPNDLVFDAHGGFYFTDPGKIDERRQDRGFLYYAKADGSSIREISRAFSTPNGVGLSPDQKTLYVAETFTGRLWALNVRGPGDVESSKSLTEPVGRLVVGLPGYQFFDSLAVDSTGHVCVGTILNGGITRCAPDGSGYEHFALPDPMTTNICFGGKDLRTAYITQSLTGRLVTARWPDAGLKLNYQTL